MEEYTPTVGINVFVIKGVASDVPTFTIFKGKVSSLIMDLFEILILTAFPGIVLWLPNILR